MSIAQALLAQNDYRIILVSRDITTRTAGRIGFEHAGSLDRAVTLLREQTDRADVHAVPAGGVILSVVMENRHHT